MDTKKNPTLQKIEEGVQAKVPQPMQAAYQKIVLAGMKIMFSAQTHPFMVQQLSQKGDVVDHVAQYVAGLLGVMYKQSKGTMPIKAAIPAATALMCEALDFLDKSGKLKITDQVVAQCTKGVAAYVLQKFGVTPQRLAQMKAGQGAPAQSAPPATPTPPAAPQGLLSQPQGA
jgi:hypothetical protein